MRLGVPLCAVLFFLLLLATTSKFKYMKRILTLLFVAFSVLAYAQPANDDCSNATTVTMVNGNGTFSGNNTLATAAAAGLFANGAICMQDPSNDIWYKFNTGTTFTDYTITVDGGYNGANPEIELWFFVQAVPGFCTNPALQNAVGCQSSANGDRTVTADFLSLNPNTEYYVRVSNWSPSGNPASMPNISGTIEPYIPPVILNNLTTGQTNTSCFGTLYDSGGDSGNYGASQNFEYTICPTDPHTCVELDVTYQFEAFPSLDRLEIYSGEVVAASNLRAILCGQGSQQITVLDSCVTVRFRSDGTVQLAGFELNWSCSNSCPAGIPASDCYTATDIPSLPFVATQQSTCGAGNNYDATDACGSSFMNGEDFVYKYVSPGDECLNVKLTNTGVNAGVFVMNGCPNADATRCIGEAVSATGNPEITSVYLEQPGTYYIVVSSETSGCATCTSYDIAVTPRPCPLTVNTNITPDSLINTIAAQGVIVENAVLDCAQGAYGVFEGGLGDGSSFMEDGIILTNGNAEGAEGPYSRNSNVQLGTPGDQLLSAITGVSTHDRCALDFDVFAPTDQLIFNYLFGSEEYNEGVNNPFNAFDVFAFLLSGPGITGQQNLAYIPNTVTPVTISSVNFFNNSVYYRNNRPEDGAAPNQEIFGYDGHTSILEARATVQACNWYHIRLVIADGFDQMFDSGVLIEANSLFANEAVVSSIGANSQIDNTNSNAAEGCSDGAFVITLLNPTGNDTLIVSYGGTATAGDSLAGADYVPLNDTLIFTGTASDTLIVHPYNDGVREGTETVTIYVTNICGDIYDSATISILDGIDQLALPTDTVFCGAPIVMPLTGSAPNIQWSPAVGLSDPTIANPIVSPDTNTTYTVIAGNGVCFDTLSIDVIPNIFQAFGDTIICEGQSTQITSYTNVPSGTSYSWSPATGLSSTTIPNPTVTTPPAGVNQYIVDFTSPGCVVQDTVTIIVLGAPSPDAGNDALICEGASVNLGYTAEPGVTYFWVNETTGDTIGNASTITVTPDVTTTYQLIAVAGDCSSVSDFVTVGVEGPFDLNASASDIDIVLGETTTLTATATGTGISPVGNLTYLWTPAATVTAPTAPTTAAAPQGTTTYTVTATSTAGCEATATIDINVEIPYFNVPNAFTPNGDGSNDEFKVLTANGAIFDVVTFQLFNRWGDLVYNGNNNNNASWDGTINGQLAPQAAYVYHVVIRLFDGTEQEFKGEVLLVR